MRICMYSHSGHRDFGAAALHQASRDGKTESSVEGCVAPSFSSRPASARRYSICFCQLPLVLQQICLRLLTEASVSGCVAPSFSSRPASARRYSGSASASFPWPLGRFARPSTVASFSSLPAKVLHRALTASANDFPQLVLQGLAQEISKQLKTQHEAKGLKTPTELLDDVVQLLNGSSARWNWKSPVYTLKGDRARTYSCFGALALALHILDGVKHLGSRQFEAAPLNGNGDGAASRQRPTERTPKICLLKNTNGLSGSLARGRKTCIIETG
eukprot:g63035.t1